MTKATTENTDELPIEALVLQNKIDKYKLSYAAIRWAKEIKKTENLPDPVPTLVPRAIREILTGKVHIKDIEVLPMMARVQAPAPAPTVPTLTLNVAPEEETAKGEI